LLHDAGDRHGDEGAWNVPIADDLCAPRDHRSRRRGAGLRRPEGT
jgi:hypothetical protein